MNNAQEVIILAGGLGTRLASHIGEAIPKPMALIQHTPFLEILLRKCAKEGFTHVIISVGHKKECIMRYFGATFLGLSITYCIEDSPLGTGGALQKALSLTHSTYTLVLNGDTFFDIHFQDFMTKHCGDSLLQLALTSLPNTRYGSIGLDSKGNIIHFSHTPDAHYPFINAGVYSVHSQLFSSFTMPQCFSFEEFLMNHYKTLCIKAQVYQAKFIDIGIPQDYQKAQTYLAPFLP